MASEYDRLRTDLDAAMAALMLHLSQDTEAIADRYLAEAKGTVAYLAALAVYPAANGIADFTHHMMALGALLQDRELLAHLHEWTEGQKSYPNNSPRYQ